MTNDFRADLEQLFGEKSFVIKDLMYQGIKLEYAVIATGRLIEVRHVISKQEYAAELAVPGRAGRISFKKHKSIKDGKFLSNAFYFLSPARILTADEVPPKYGLIHYNAKGELSFKREADWIDQQAYLTPSNLLTIARKLAADLYTK